MILLIEKYQVGWSQLDWNQVKLGTLLAGHDAPSTGGWDRYGKVRSSSKETR